MALNEAYSEKELLLRIAEGDQLAFREIVVSYRGKLEAFVLHMTKSPELTEEVVQDSFMLLWLTRERLTDIEHFSNYLFILCRNQSLNALRKVLRDREKQRALEANLPFESFSSIPESPNELLVTLVQKGVDLLPPQQKKAWELSRRQEKKYHEIAAEMKVSAETVKTHIKLANQSIVSYLRLHKDLLFGLAIAFIQ